jgi:hypothetical protein
MVTVVLADGVRATFAGSGVGPGAPSGPGVLALWLLDDGLPAGEGALELAQPVGRRLQRRRVGGRRVGVGEVLAELVALPRHADVTPSVAAWAVAAQIAVDLVARGRIRPARTRQGTAGWAVGPLDLADRQRLTDLAAALPI